MNYVRTDLAGLEFIDEFYFSFKFLLLLFSHFWRERESNQGRGREREGERESQAGSTLSAQSPMRGPNSRTVRSWPEPKSTVRRSTDWAPPGVPSFHWFKPCFGHLIAGAAWGVRFKNTQIIVTWCLPYMTKSINRRRMSSTTVYVPLTRPLPSFWTFSDHQGTKWKKK